MDKLERLMAMGIPKEPQICVAFGIPKNIAFQEKDMCTLNCDECPYVEDG